MIEIDIEVKNDNWLLEQNIEKKIEEICLKLIPETNLKEILIADLQLDLAISLVSNKQIQEINKKFRDKDKPTDILSFPQIDEDFIRKNSLKEAIGNSPYVFLGDIVISYETSKEDAKKQKKDFANHLTHLILHSLLHLIGYDHENEEMARIMENEEIKILKKFGIQNPYIF